MGDYRHFMYVVEINVIIKKNTLACTKQIQKKKQSQNIVYLFR